MEQNESLTVLLIEPERYPKVVQIGSDLKSLQQAVGGWIEAVYPWEDKAAIILNEEGKINQLPLNRALRTDARCRPGGRKLYFPDQRPAQPLRKALSSAGNLHPSWGPPYGFPNPG